MTAAAELPTGTLTLLFSDMERSTVLLHRLGPRWGEALSDQRRLLRAAWAAHHGVEMGTEGDSFFVVFRTAGDAIGAALDGQRALQGHDWPEDETVRVRMGLHTGEPTRHEDGYVGETVHHAARIAATAHGGQIVVSAATRSLIGDVAGAQVRDLGHHRLKDITGETHLFDVIGAGLLADFPPLRSLGKSATLPVARTPLVGRAAEVAELVIALGAPGRRLVTVTGPGGAGKTRLSVEVARTVAAEHPDGVYFVGLHTTRTADAMLTAIGDALDIAPAETGPAARVAGYLADRRVLLVLDNLEQIPDADRAVSAVLDAGPGVQVLASSRTPLLLAGEQEYPVPPMALPTGADDVDAPAVELFTQYARGVRPGFAVTDANRADVVALCRALDGLPLALELAAAQLRLLSPKALLSRLTSELGTGSTAADRPDRHRSVGAAIAWGYDLLPADQQQVFDRLGVFAGDNDLDAISAVVMDDGADVLDVLPALVSAHMVRVLDGTDGEPRIGQLQTVRRFARDRLRASGTLEELRLRHLRWCAAVVAQAAPRVNGALGRAARDEIAAVQAEVEAALEWAFTPQTPDDGLAAGLELVRGLFPYWYRYGTLTDAAAWVERAVQTARDRGRPEDIDLMHSLGVMHDQRANIDAALAVFGRELEMAERLGDLSLQSRAANSVAVTRRRQGALAEAEVMLRRSLDLARQAADPAREATALSNLVIVLVDGERYAEAIPVAEEAMAVDLAADDLWGLAVDRVNFLTLAINVEGPAAAHAKWVEWAEQVDGVGDAELTVNLVEVGATVIAGLGAHADAAELLGHADRRREEIGVPRSDADTDLLTRWLGPGRDVLGPDEWEARRSAGRARTPAAALGLVRAAAPAGQPR